MVEKLHIDMKAVVNHSQSSSVIISDKWKSVSSEHSSNEASITADRLTERKLCKQSKSVDTCILETEPSKIRVKKVIQIMRKRKLRRKCKMVLKKSAPPSSIFFI